MIEKLKKVDREIGKLNHEFNYRIHIYLLIIFLSVSALFIVYSYILFGLLTIPYAISIFLITLVGENIVSRTGSYSYNMNHKPIEGRVPLFIPLLWLAVSLGSLCTSYTVLNLFIIADKMQIVLVSALIALMVDSLLLEPILSKKKKIWVWKGETVLHAPVRNYLVWFAFPFIMNTVFLFGDWFKISVFILISLGLLVYIKLHKLHR